MTPAEHLRRLMEERLKESPLDATSRDVALAAFNAALLALLENRRPDAYISPHSLERVASNDGVLRMTAFSEYLSHSPNGVQTEPLYALTYAPRGPR